MLESFLVHLSSSMGAAIHNIKEDLGSKTLNEREILGKISLVRDVTAKDGCSFVRNDLVYEVKAGDYDCISKEIVSRAPLGTVADAVEFFAAFSKDPFSALLIYEPRFEQELNVLQPIIIPSFEETRLIVLKTKYTVAPFKRAKVRCTSVKTLIHSKFPNVKKLGKKGNNTKVNYGKLMENLLLVRHAVTHNNGRFGVAPKADIPFLK